VEGTPHKENWFSTGEVEFALQKRATNHYAGFREANQWVAPHLSRENTDNTTLTPFPGTLSTGSPPYLLKWSQMSRRRYYLDSLACVTIGFTELPEAGVTPGILLESEEPRPSQRLPISSSAATFRS
jgi:hypothetical protein